MTIKSHFCGHFLSYFDAVAVSHGNPHGHGDWWDNKAKDVQQRGTEVFPKLFRGLTGEAGAAPKGKTTFRRTRERVCVEHKDNKNPEKKENMRKSQISHHRVPLENMLLCFVHFKNLLSEGN